MVGVSMTTRRRGDPPVESMVPTGQRRLLPSKPSVLRRAVMRVEGVGPTDTNSEDSDCAAFDPGSDRRADSARHDRARPDLDPRTDGIRIRPPTGARVNFEVPRTDLRAPSASNASAIARAASASTATVPAATTSAGGNAFDTCAAPTAAQMQSWLSSPYRSVGIYIGGTARGCAQPNLTKDWVSTVTGQGWGLLPIYVGLQAPCYGGNKPMSTSVSTAAAQGTAAANDAITQMSALGISSTSPVYLDIEDYSTTNPSCVAAVKAFTRGWTSTLNSKGRVPGIYGTTGSMVADLVYWRGVDPSYPQPSEVWFAHTGQPANTDDASIPPDAWSGHRVHQFTQNVTETYSGVSLTIDADVTSASVFTAVGPSRLYDSVTATIGTGAIAVKVAGHAGVPTNATAVALTIQIAGPTANAQLVVAPYQSSSGIGLQQFTKGQSISQTVIVGLHQGNITTQRLRRPSPHPGQRRRLLQRRNRISVHRGRPEQAVRLRHRHDRHHQHRRQGRRPRRSPHQRHRPSPSPSKSPAPPPTPTRRRPTGKAAPPSACNSSPRARASPKPSSSDSTRATSNSASPPAKPASWSTSTATTAQQPDLGSPRSVRAGCTTPSPPRSAPPTSHSRSPARPESPPTPPPSPSPSRSPAPPPPANSSSPPTRAAPASAYNNSPKARASPRPSSSDSTRATSNVTASPPAKPASWSTSTATTPADLPPDQSPFAGRTSILTDSPSPTVPVVLLDPPTSCESSRSTATARVSLRTRSSRGTTDAQT